MSRAFPEKVCKSEVDGKRSRFFTSRADSPERFAQGCANLIGIGSNIVRRILACAALLGLLTGCHSLFGDDSSDHAKPKDEGKRISVLEMTQKLEPDHALNDIKPELPAPVLTKDWPQAGGNPEHSLPHSALAALPQERWHVDIGAGSNGNAKLLARPVIAEGRVFTLDATGAVAAFAIKDGTNLWRTPTTPEGAEDSMGGGLGFTQGRLFVTTGQGEVIALRAANGHVLWRAKLGKPFRSPPTIADGRVYAVSLDNELNALDLKTGELLWHHNGIAESATLMGASSPAVTDDNVIVAYSSGEIFNLRAQNGRMVWTDVLAVPAQVGALPAIADIRGLPVVDRGLVFAVSHSGRMAAIDLRSGDRAWEADVGGTNTPVVAGNAVYVLSNDNELIALTREGGRILWIKQLQRLAKPAERDSAPVFWAGPLLAGGKLWLTNTLGQLVAFAPDNGAERVKQRFAAPFFIPPIIADGTLYVLSDEGRLTALR